ncbi:MAG: thioredoxin family protein [Anaerolineales bacterium]|jgi:thioredoxin 1
MAFLNQFSFLLLGAGLLLVLVFYLRRRGPAEGSLIAVGSLLIGLAFAYLFFRPVGSTDISGDAFGQVVNGETPVLLEFQSPYCIACMAVEPTIKKIETEFADELLVVKVNVLEEATKPLRKRFEFQYTPTFIFLNPEGQEIWRTVGVLDPQHVASTLDTLR